MPDGLDRLMSTLGLDSHRIDQVLGTAVARFPPLETGHEAQGIQPSLYRREDGVRHWVFQVTSGSSHWITYLPCTPANLQRLEEFLTRAHQHLPATRSVAAQTGWGWRTFLDRREVLGSVTAWEDGPTDTVLQLKLLAPDRKGPHLRFIILGPRGLLRRDLPWNLDQERAWVSLLRAGRDESLA